MKTTLNIDNGSRLVAGIKARLGSLALASLALATVPVYADQASVQCLQSGANDQYLKVCWSEHGNITSFESPQGSSHLPMDGYAVCYGSGAGLSAWDAKFVESGWGPATLSPDKKVITRKTTDGKLQLKQTFSKDSPEKDFTIKMELKNVSGSPVYVSGFARYFDADVDNSGTTDVFIRTPDSVAAFGIDGFSLTAITDFPVTSIHKYNELDWAKCSQAGGWVSPAGPGNYAGRVNIPVGFNLGPNQVENATFVYRRF